MANQYGRFGEAPRCGRCGGRLFKERESDNAGRLIPYWECSVGCGQRFLRLTGDPGYSVGVLPVPRTMMRQVSSKVIL